VCRPSVARCRTGRPITEEIVYSFSGIVVAFWLLRMTGAPNARGADSDHANGSGVGGTTFSEWRSQQASRRDENAKHLRAAQEGEPPPFEPLIGEAQARKPAHQLPQRDLRFESGERCTQTEMVAEPKGEVVVVGACEIEAVRVRVRVAVGSPEQKDHVLPLPEADPVERDVLLRDAGRELDRRVVA
jgi:hypothetical protein